MNVRAPVEVSQHQAQSRRSAHGGIAVLLCLALVAFYAPVLTNTYGYADDFPQLREAAGGAKWLQTAMNAAGRPIGGYLAEYSFRAARTVEGLACLRAAAVALICGMALLIYRQTLPVLRRRWLAAGAALFVCTLPPVQIYAAWASLWLYLLPVPLGFAAYRLLIRGLERPESRFPALSGSAALMYVGFNIYPPAAMFVWLWPALDLWSCEARQQIRRWLGTLGLCAAAGGAYLAIYKLMGYAHPRARFSADPVTKLKWFGSTVIGSAFRLDWFDLSSSLFPAAVLMLIAAGAFAVHRKPARALVMIALFCCTLPCAYMPVLAAAEFDVTFRSQIALAAVVALAVWMAVCMLLRRATPILALILALACFRSVQNLRSFVEPQAAEYAMLRKKLTRVNSGKPVLVRHADPARWFAAKGRWDEFHTITSVMPEEYGMLGAMAYLSLRDDYGWQGRDLAKVGEIAFGASPKAPAAQVIEMDDAAQALLLPYNQGPKLP